MKIKNHLIHFPDEKGPFDIIGDVHGCIDELKLLLQKLGYQIKMNEKNSYTITHPQRRKVIFVGDLVDRGPNTPEVLRMVMDMVRIKIAFCVNGNHDDKLKRKLQGRQVKVTNGLAESLIQLEQETAIFKNKVIVFLDSLPSHMIFDEGKLVVAHAGVKEACIGSQSARTRAFCLYGEIITGSVDALGLPIRHPWAQDYQGKAVIVYGHTPIEKPTWLNNTINIDTGCVFGGEVTSLRYPEKAWVSVPAARVYYSRFKN